MSKKTVPETRLTAKAVTAKAVTAKGAGDTYEVTVNNKSNRPWMFFLYQKPPPESINAQSLAWIASPYHIAVDASITFSWSITYQFVWANTGVLKPGITFRAGSVKDANLRTANVTTFSMSFNTPNLSDPTGGGLEGSLTINDAGDVPSQQFSVGVAMSGKGTYVVNSGPNLKHVFTPHPSYWICAINKVEEGEVMDIQTLTQNMEFKFPANVFHRTATLNEQNLWEIQ